MPSSRTVPPPPTPPRIALVGDRSSSVRAHGKIPVLLAALATSTREAPEAYWIPTATVRSTEDLAGFDGIWVVPGSPYASPEGVLRAVETARTRLIPFLGTCGGFQHMLMEFARNVCHLGAVDHAEVSPDSPNLLIVPLECSLLGEEAKVSIVPGTLASAALGPGVTSERYFCRYGLSNRYRDDLEDNGLIFSGVDDRGDVRAAELAGHPFFLGTLFQPELSSDATWVHPIIAGFVTAVRNHAVDAPAAMAE
jgi:CTP synthase (UTP-ammonia lyase)